jgi:hypothetical protein
MRCTTPISPNYCAPAIAKEAIASVRVVERSIDCYPEGFDRFALACSVDCERADKNAGTDVDADLRVVGLERRSLEVVRQVIADRRKVEEEKIGDRRGAIGAALVGQESIEAVKELLGEADLSLRHADGGVARRARPPLPVLRT